MSSSALLLQLRLPFGMGWDDIARHLSSLAQHYQLEVEPRGFSSQKGMTTALVLIQGDPLPLQEAKGVLVRLVESWGGLVETRARSYRPKCVLALEPLDAPAREEGLH